MLRERILISHGSGGRLTKTLIETIFQKYFDFEELKRGDDGGLFQTIEGKYVISTDSYVVDPIFFPGGDIGSLAISGTINDLASMGAEPVCISAGFILEEGLSVESLEKIISSMANLLKKERVPLITADTKVIENKGGTESALFINTTGIGRIIVQLPDRTSVTPGDTIIVNGTIGEHGFSVLSARMNLASEDPIISDAKPLWSLVKSLLNEANVKFMRDPTRGGLAGVLNELVEGMSFGVLLYEDKIPVSDKVRGISELLGIDPLEVANEGKMVFIVDKKHSKKAIEILRDHPDGKKAQIIGEITEKYPGKVIVQSPYGTRRILQMPLGEQLPRIC